MCCEFAFAGALLCFLGMFATVKSFGLPLLIWVFFVGFFAHLPFACTFMYAPELFPATIRGTAMGFTLQSSRLIGALAALLGGQLVSFFSGSYATAASCVAWFYLVGMVASFFMTSTTGEVVPAGLKELASAGGMANPLNSSVANVRIEAEKLPSGLFETAIPIHADNLPMEACSPLVPFVTRYMAGLRTIRCRTPFKPKAVFCRVAAAGTGSAIKSVETGTSTKYLTLCQLWHTMSQ